MLKLFIEPVDVLLLRDDRPFGQTGTQSSRSLFPPRPSVIAGAIRSRFMAEEGVDFDAYGKALRDDERNAAVPDAVKRLIGFPPRQPGTLAIRNIQIARKGPGGVEPLEYTPLDLLQEKAPKKEPRFALAAPAAVEHAGKGSSQGLGLLPPWCAGLKQARRVEGYLTAEDYERYLLGESPKAVLSPDAVYGRHVRTGIGLDREARTVEEGRLYSSECVEMTKTADVVYGFLVVIEGIEAFPEQGFLRFGGDGRMARVELVEVNRVYSRDALVAQIDRTKRFRLVVRTPARLEKGWIPAGCEAGPEGIRWRHQGLSFRLVAAAVGEAQPLGGWDLARQAPKPLRTAVPAGSVYWFKIETGTGEDVVAALHERSIDEEAPGDGFGLVHVGVW